MLALTVLSLAASALALEISTLPSNIHSASNTTISWTSENGDPDFNIFIFKDTFNNRYAIANNVPVANHSITLALPAIPTDSGYVYQFTNISDDNDVYAKSAAFPVAAACDSGCDSTSSVAASAAGTSGASKSGASSTGSSTSAGAAASQTGGAATFRVSAALGVAAGLLAWMTL
ncbi:hypothetical protein BDZ89DRAFT_1062292 [Hymenopellis radicata]|nr:hypothetical protein BDZ89DRAFT_1062292 [Hymenopellis radicata]